MKKTVSLLLTSALLLGLCACGGNADSSPTESVLPVDDAQAALLPDDVPALPEGTTGQTIALAVDAAGLDDAGKNAAAWRGVQAFGENFGFTTQSYAADENTSDAAESALRQAAESGAGLVVCLGEGMASALYNLQGNYPTVSYLMLDDEPHSADYTSYTTAANVHCVLFQEEQAGYLAGFAAVTEGYTQLGFLGADAMPEIVRYCTGYLQGAEAAAELSGVQVRVKTWYSGSYTASEDITARMSGWYSDGTQLIFAAGGTLAQSCVAAAQDTGGKVAAANWDQSALGDSVLTSAIKCYSAAVQNQLYLFYAGGNAWDQDRAGQTERLGASDEAVALSTSVWRFARFEQDEYETQYSRLHDSAVKVERFSDAGTLPEMANVTVDVQN